MPPTPKREPRETVEIDPLANLLVVLGARAPTTHERQALQHMARGNAGPGEQRAAMAYVLDQLCGVTRSTFDLDPRVGAVRQGAHAVGVALTALADGSVVHFGGVIGKSAENG